MTLNSEINEFLKNKGVLKVGFATKETLAGGPPSADIAYILPEAESAVSFALPLDKKKIRSFLSKKNYKDHVLDNIEVNRKCVFIAQELSEMLQERGYKADIAPPPGDYATWGTTSGYVSSGMENEYQYRQEIPGWRLTLPPKISHRYIAVVSGVGSFGWSGNVGMKGYGTTIILGTTFTSAKLEPTSPIPLEENFCDDCKLCVNACPTKLMERDKTCDVQLGENTFSYSARRSLTRCQIACGGFSGLDKSKKWSSWSPGRYEVPDDDVTMIKTLGRAFANQKKWPKNSNSDFDVPLRLTCANCQLICFGNRKETAQNYKMLVKSGCVIQEESGDFVVLPHDEAQQKFDNMNPKHKKKYV